MAERIRVLLPVRPDNDCSEPARILDALFGREAVSILRIFVYRPAELDTYAPEMLAAVPGIHRLDADQLRDAVSSARLRCQGLVDHGFHVESAIVAGFPVDKIIAEAKSWKADLILVHVMQETSHECRIGPVVGTLIDSSPVPVLLYPKISETIGKRIAVLVDDDAHSASALQWASKLGARQNAEIHRVHVKKNLASTVEREKCDLVIIPAHHQFAPAILGSTDRRIIRHTDIPVVVIPH